MEITLPDGSVKQFDAPVTGLEIAESIGAGLRKAAVAIEVNGIQQDLSEPISESCDVSILTTSSAGGLDVMRHTLAAQVLARACRELFPGCKLAIGPTIDWGFYYDIEFERSLTLEDLTVIEERMNQIVDEKNGITRTMMPREDAIELFRGRGEPYKVEIIEGTEGQESFPIYVQEGTDFVDLCRGPHLPSLDKVGAFKLTKLAGAYWRGDSNNTMLTRIYGTAWASKKELRKYLHQLEEAEKRDHRKLGRELSLFHMQEEAPGQVFWHHKGWTVFLELQEYIRSKLRPLAYQEVNTPQIISSSLYEKSGHWDKFGTGNMFITEPMEGR